MSKLEVNTVEPQCGTNLTIGASGDTITFPSGTTVVNNGSQTGFGRTGTVDWQTGSIKTSTFTAANGEGYFANTSGGAFTMNLPAGSAGSIVSVVDYTNTFDSEKLTIAPNGTDKIGGINASASLSTQGQSVTLVFVDATEGWITTNDSTENIVNNPNLVATGGTITTCGNDKIHTFTGPGTFTVTNLSSTPANNTVSYLVVAGGGSGAAGCRQGAGGAGGYREVKSPTTPYTASPLDGYPSAPNRVTVTEAAFPITVGAGGANATYAGSVISGNNGSTSIFSTITSAGGGAGTTGNGGNGGSGGGGSHNNYSGGTGNTPPVSPSQGNNGGNGNYNINAGSGGGGGAGAAGQNAQGNPTPGRGGNGGDGVSTSITGSSVTRAGGGGGAGDQGPRAGGSGGGGAAGSGTNGVAGTVNTGGGGGNTGNGSNSPGNTSGAGGSGIVVIRYKFQ
jgi:hypothetical protein